MSTQNLTGLLVAWGEGDREALDRLAPLVYGELRRLAVRYLHRERPGHTLDTGALVHEAFLRLVEQRRVSWQGRAHFYGVAALMMRRVLVEHARVRGLARRGRGAAHLPLEGGCVPAGGVTDTLGLTDCCRGAGVAGSTRCLAPADFGTTWRTCVHDCV